MWFRHILWRKYARNHARNQSIDKGIFFYRRWKKNARLNTEGKRIPFHATFTVFSPGGTSFSQSCFFLDEDCTFLMVIPFYVARSYHWSSLYQRNFKKVFRFKWKISNESSNVKPKMCSEYILIYLKGYHTLRYVESANYGINNKLKSYIFTVLDKNCINIEVGFGEILIGRMNDWHSSGRSPYHFVLCFAHFHGCCRAKWKLFALVKSMHVMLYAASNVGEKDYKHRFSTVRTKQNDT